MFYQIEELKDYLKSKRFKRDLVGGVVTVAVGATVYLIYNHFDKESRYNKAAKLFRDEKYAEAAGTFRALGDYKCAREYLEICKSQCDFDEEEEEEDSFLRFEDFEEEK